MGPSHDTQPLSMPSPPSNPRLNPGHPELTPEDAFPWSFSDLDLDPPLAHTQLVGGHHAGALQDARDGGLDLGMGAHDGLNMLGYEYWTAPLIQQARDTASPFHDSFVEGHHSAGHPITFPNYPGYNGQYPLPKSNFNFDATVGERRLGIVFYVLTLM